MKRTLRQATLLAVILSLGLAALPLFAQTAELPRRTEIVRWSSGVHDGTGDLRSDGVAPHRMALRDVVSVPGVPWIRLKFTHADLGANSYIELTSVADGARQRLDASTIRDWGLHTAYFNGDAVEVRLHVAPQDRRVALEIEEVVVGEWAWGGDTRSICGVDNRIASNEPRVARIDPIGCTGWIVDNGKYLTAGHCLAGGSSNQTLSFNPPASLPDGTVQFPGPEDQYSINQSSFDFTNGGVGNDWGIFTVFDNTQTGLQPIEAQGSFSVRQDLGPANIRITGFGVDSGTTNQTNQTHVGPNAGSSGTTMRYTADTTGGNSGSPVIDEATGEAVGIHSHGGCSGSGGNNSGTSFFNNALWTALDAGGGGGGPTVDCPPGSIDFDTLALTSYSNQNASNNSAVEDDGDILLLTGNTWVRSTQSFNVTANTVLDFQFASGSQGEIHAIGFDEDDTLNNAGRHFQFWGTQNWTGTGRIDWTPKYSGAGAFQSYSIPVGQSYTGTMRLVFTNDKDAGTLNNQSRFACVVVREEAGSGCDVDEGFEGGLGGWTTSGTCSTGTFVSGTPDAVTNGGVTTQVGGAQSGNNALYTQPNGGGAGTNDVDGGECVATSPVYNVTAASDVSIWYFHGQRDQGDDAAGDYFVLERSVNGGAFQSLASFGDVTVNAAWTESTSTVGAGTVQFRVRVSDGAGPGDLVEAGVDSVSVCAQ